MRQTKPSTAEAAPHDGKSKNSVAIRFGRETAAFDDRDLPEEHLKEIDELVRRIKGRQALQLESVHEIGGDLLRLRELVGHGKFLAWIEHEFGLSDRTARYHMSVARQPVGKMATVANLDHRTIYALVAKSTPEEIRDDLFSRAEN